MQELCELSLSPLVQESCTGMPEFPALTLYPLRRFMASSKVLGEETVKGGGGAAGVSGAEAAREQDK